MSDRADTTGVADAHCHLADLPDPDAAVEAAAAAAAGPILAVAMGPDDGSRVLELKAHHPGMVLAGIGLHPSRVPEITDEEAAGELKLVAERAPKDPVWLSAGQQQVTRSSLAVAVRRKAHKSLAS